MWTLIIIIVVVVLVDDDTYYWVYLSSNHLFQVYYKVRQVLLSATIITKCDSTGALSLVLNRVYNFTIKRLEQGAFLEKRLR